MPAADGKLAAGGVELVLHPGLRAVGFPELHGFAAGLDRDRDAVVAGLTQVWSSGIIESHVGQAHRGEDGVVGDRRRCWSDGAVNGRLAAVAAA
ncbi:hypothetical protein AB0J90_18475 [Micromonospora sp. NPDC049523]|uniref:hypothetical protein n=1 Tax=Micromonospora sp. NPDC049523 TaxID=3155921 RepID=UPI003446C224